MVQERYPRASVGESIIRSGMGRRFENGGAGFSYLDGPPTLLAAADTPVPISQGIDTKRTKASKEPRMQR